MRKLNNDMHELNINELDAASAGSNFSATVFTNIAANKRFNEWEGRDANSKRQPPANVTVGD
jgi:hypothetical protein